MTQILKLNQNTVAELTSGMAVKVLSALDHLRSKGNVGYLPIIFDELLNTQDVQIRDNIAGFLSEIKDSNAIKPLVEAINDQKYKSILPMLVSACWQNGLDFSDHTQTFVTIFIRENFVVSIEAFSVFDNIIDFLSAEQQENVAKEITSALPEMETEKQKLAQELIKLLE